MSWAEAGPDERFDTTHMTFDYGEIEKVGSARWFFAIRNYESFIGMSNIWPPLNSPERARMTEFAIANAALLGATFELNKDKVWCVAEDYSGDLVLHFAFEDQGESAVAYLAHKGWWVCFNKQADQWELTRV